MEKVVQLTIPVDDTEGERLRVGSIYSIKLILDNYWCPAHGASVKESWVETARGRSLSSSTSGTCLPSSTSPRRGRDYPESGSTVRSTRSTAAAGR